MTVFSLKTKKNNKRNSFFLVVFILLLIILFYWNSFSFLNKGTSFLLRPVFISKQVSTDFIKSFFEFLVSKKLLVEENSFLRDEINKKNLLLTRQNILEEENILLKETLNYVQENENSVLANVILKPGFNLYNSLFIDVGSNTGIKKGNRVLVENVLIGEVEEVYIKSAKIRLYSFPGDKLNLALGLEKIAVVATAKSDGVFEIRVPQDLDIKKGAPLTFPGENLRIVALVEDIIKNSEDPFQTILCKSPVNFFELRWVQIIKD